MTQRETTEFIKSLRSGERAAIETLVREHVAAMRSVARRLLGHETGVNDVVRDAFLAAFRGLANSPEAALLGTWLNRIVISSALMRLRSHAKAEEDVTPELLPRFEPNGAFSTAQAPWPPDSSTPTMSAETRHSVRACIDSLPDRLRTALVLRDIEGLASGELAQQLGTSADEARGRVHRARQALRTLLDQAREEGAR